MFLLGKGLLDGYKSSKGPCRSVELYGLKPVRNPAYNPWATKINTLEIYLQSKHLWLVCHQGNGIHLQLMMWLPSYFQAPSRRFWGVTPLISVDFHHTDVRSAGYRLCMALRVGGVMVALDGAGPVFRSYWASVQPLPVPSQPAWPHLGPLKSVWA